MRKRKIYIAGKVTGEDHLECAAKFNRAQMQIEKLNLTAINPLGLVGDWNAPWDVAMKKCIKAMMDADAVYLLPCTLISKGATIEMKLARDLNIPTYPTIDLIKLDLT